jgi:hypothetical protein
MKIKSILSLLAVTLFAGVTIPAFGQSYSASPTPPPGYIPKYVSQTDQYGHYEGTSPYQYLSFWGATRGPQLSSTNDLLSLVKTIGLVQSNTTGVLQVTTATAVGTVTVTGSATVVVTGVALSGTAHPRYGLRRSLPPLLPARQLAPISLLAERVPTSS